MNPMLALFSIIGTQKSDNLGLAADGEAIFFGGELWILKILKKK